MNHIHYVECDATHASNFIFDIPQGHHCWLLVITKTPAQFWVNGELKNTRPTAQSSTKHNRKSITRPALINT